MKSGCIGVLKISNYPKIAPLGMFGKHLIGCADVELRILDVGNFYKFSSNGALCSKKIVTFADDTAKVSQSP